MRYWVCGVNSMGTTWYLGDKDDSECTVWSGAPKENRYTFDDLDTAHAKVAELDENFKFASTRHHCYRAD